VLELFFYLQKMLDNDTKELILIATLIFLIAPTFILIYILVYNQRKKRHIEEKQNLQSTFRQELLKTQVEVQEQTLRNISREIHDNISQVLSFIKLNLAMIDQGDEHTKAKINESRELVAQVINDLRNLSKSLSFEHIAELGLVKTIEMETDRINNSGLLKTSLVIEGDSYSLGEQRELVLFRIFQETLNNTLKHAHAKHLKISLQYSELIFNLTIEDDGIGFSFSELDNNHGSGLKNMQSRAALIGAVANFNSWPGKGCSIKVYLNPLEKQIYGDGNYPNSPG
jgi:signal transduction histidine kinase